MIVNSRPLTGIASINNIQRRIIQHCLHDMVSSRADYVWGTPLVVPQYWIDQTWGKWAIIEGDNFFFINCEVALYGRIRSELPDSNADRSF